MGPRDDREEPKPQARARGSAGIRAAAKAASGDGPPRSGGKGGGQGLGQAGERGGGRELGGSVGPGAGLGAWVPSVALAILTVFAGSYGATGAYGAMAAHAAVLLLALAGAGVWSDPLALGRRGRWLVAALVVTVAASCWASPVSRAGWTVVALVPAWLLAAAGVARWWSGPGGAAEGWRGASRGVGRGASRAPLAPALLVAAVAGHALVSVARGVDPRASGLLGHHNFLAVWLVVVLPLAVLPWRRGGWWRLAAGVAGGLGVAALVLGRSLSGALGLATVLLVGWLLGQRLGGARGREPGFGEDDGEGRGAGGAAEPARVAGGDRRRGGTDRGRRWRRPAAWGAAALLLLVPLLAALPRLLSVLGGSDLSLHARRAYWAAGLEGWTLRPTLGWGPGSTPWTISQWLRPVPGVHPPSELVGDLHSLPLALLYEVGFVGAALALAVAGLFALRRWRGMPAGTDPALGAAGLAGLAGGAVATLGVMPLQVPAVVAALAVAAGAALAGCSPQASRLAAGIDRQAPPLAESPASAGPAPGELEGTNAERAGTPARPGVSRRSAWPAWTWIAGAAILLAWLDGAHLAYDRSAARPPAAASPATAFSSEAGSSTEASASQSTASSSITTTTEGSSRSLLTAVASDPRFPLYRAQLAGEGGFLPPTRDPLATPPGLPTLALRARQARRAAEDAVAVPALWLLAGDLGRQAAEPWSAAALGRACSLDPLAPAAPFLLAQVLDEAGDPEGAARAAGRALLAEPRLAASRFLAGRPALRAAAVEEARAWPGVDDGWKEELARQVSALGEGDPSRAVPLRVLAGGGGGQASGRDGGREAAGSLAHYTFRRLPRRLVLATLHLDPQLLSALDLPPVTLLPETAPEAFGDRGCGEKINR